MNKLAIGFIIVCLVGVTIRVPALRFAVLRKVLPLAQRLSVHALGGGVYWISGGISNTGFVIGNKSVIAFDAQMFLPVARRELQEIAKLTSKPVNIMVLSHSDPDHINGLPAFPRGMEIIAHQNVVSDMKRLVQDPTSNGFPPEPGIGAYIPTRTVQTAESMILDGVSVELISAAPAHTNSDLVMYLPAQKIVFAGDLITPSVSLYPGIHLDKNGSSLGWLQAMRLILALNATTYISGHGELLSKAELMDRLRLAEERRARIKELVDQGKTLKEIKAQLKDVPLNGVARQFPTFIETTYQELSKDKPASSSAIQ